MADSINIEPLARPVEAVVSLPGSKSITNRALVLSALADTPTRLIGALDADDTVVMAECLRRMGTAVDVRAEGWDVRPGRELRALRAPLYVGNSGTTLRFLLPVAALGSGEFVFTGTDRLAQRPVTPLLDAIAEIGADARQGGDGPSCVATIIGHGTLAGGAVRIDASASSQFVSGLLMAAPLMATGLDVRATADVRPAFIAMTVRMMDAWGGRVRAAEGRWSVPASGRYHSPSTYQIEPDASAASYFFAAAAISGGRVTVRGIGHDSLQGDTAFATATLASLGCTVTASADAVTVQGPPCGNLTGIDVDMGAISDTALTLAAIAPFASSPTRIRGIAHTRLQECDRIRAAVDNLGRLGATVKEFEDGLEVQPAANLKPASLPTYGDHRVAMSFAIAGLRTPGVRIEDPGCVAKTFPAYWETLASLRPRETLR